MKICIWMEESSVSPTFDCACQVTAKPPFASPMTLLTSLTKLMPLVSTRNLAADLVAVVVEPLGLDRAASVSIATQEAVVLPGRNEAAAWQGLSPTTSPWSFFVMRVDQELAADLVTAGIEQLRLDRAAGIAALCRCRPSR